MGHLGELRQARKLPNRMIGVSGFRSREPPEQLPCRVSDRS
jgi:hypothetical protein